MTLQQLEYLVALDNYRHFVKAAEHCFVTQPTLTMQVKKLEDEIGVKVFNRSAKPLQPTVAGEKILVKARQIIREVEALKAFVTDETESVQGEFTLGIIPTITPYLLPRFLPTFVKNSPQTHLKIQELQTDQIIERLKKGTLDMAIISTPVNDSQIRTVPMYNEPFLLYLPVGHQLIQSDQITMDKLDVNDMLFLEVGHCFRDQALAICSMAEPYRNKSFEFYSGSIQALKGLVNNNMGYTLVPELSVIDELDSPQIRRFTSPEPVREISIVTHNSFTKEALIDRIHQTVLKSIPDSFSRLRRYTRVTWR